MVKILSKSWKNCKAAQFPKLCAFVGQNSILRHYYIKNVKNGMQIRVCNMNKENLTHFSQFF